MFVFKKRPFHSTDKPPFHLQKDGKWESGGSMAVVNRRLIAVCGEEVIYEKGCIIASFSKKSHKEELCKKCLRTFISERKARRLAQAQEHVAQ